MTTKDMSRIKLPAFIYDSPVTWWLTCDSIFSTYRIKNGTEKYNHLIANLPADVTSKLIHVLNTDVEETADVDPRLDLLKAALFQRYAPTDYQAFLNYDNMKPLQAGMKPTALLDSLRVALPAHVCVDTYFFMNKFLSLLPPLTRAQCLAANIADISELAAFADNVHITSASSVAAIDDISDDSVCATSTQKPQRPPPPPSTSPPDATCFYHRRYGTQAIRCKGNRCPQAPPSNKSSSGNGSRSGGSN